MIFNKVRTLKEQGKTIGITFSTFDMLHAGHVAMLAEAKNHCDYLIAGLQTDPTIDRPDTKNKPVQSIVERQIQLAACRYVDDVVPNYGGADSTASILMVNPDLIVVGSDWATRDYYDQMNFTQAWLDAHGIGLCYIPYTQGISTTAIRKRLSLG
mgnify:CR=1 FL=1